MIGRTRGGLGCGLLRSCFSASCQPSFTESCTTRSRRGSASSTSRSVIPPVFGTESPTLLGIGWGILATWWVGLLLGVPLAFAARAGSPKRDAQSIFKPIGVLLLDHGNQRGRPGPFRLRPGEMPGPSACWSRSHRGFLATGMRDSWRTSGAFGELLRGVRGRAHGHRRGLAITRTPVLTACGSQSPGPCSGSAIGRGFSRSQTRNAATPRASEPRP